MESISNLISIPIFIEKPLSEQERRWILQREIFVIIEQENIRLLNWKRYITYLKKYKIRERKLGRDHNIKVWQQMSRSKLKDKEVSKIQPLTKKSFGVFTSHVNSDDMFAIKSNVIDRHNRGESPTCYIYSLSKYDKI